MDSGWDADYRRRGRLYGGGVRLPPLSHGARVLDLGCGDGRSLRALRAVGAEAIGVDASPGALALSRACLDGDCSRLVLADARRLPFADAAFDAVLLHHVLGHADAGGRARLAAEAVRVTRPGGGLHLRVFSGEDFRAASGEAVEPDSRRRGGVLTHYFSEAEVASLFGGCRVVRLETIRWHLRVRGKVHPRAEVEAELERRADASHPAPVAKGITVSSEPDGRAGDRTRHQSGGAGTDDT